MDDKKSVLQGANMAVDIINMDVIGFYMGMMMFWFSGFYCFMAMAAQYTAGNYETVLALCGAALYMVGIYVFRISALRDQVKSTGGLINMKELSEYNKLTKK